MADADSDLSTTRMLKADMPRDRAAPQTTHPPLFLAQPCQEINRISAEIHSELDSGNRRERCKESVSLFAIKVMLADQPDLFSNRVTVECSDYFQTAKGWGCQYIQSLLQ